MTLQVKSFTPTAAGALLFSDFDGRADQPTLLGVNWLCAVTDCPPSPPNGPGLASAYNVSALGLTMATSGSNGQSCIYSVPWVMDLATLGLRPQFSQFRMDANNSTAIILDRRGPCVFAIPSAGGSSYAIYWNAEQLKCELWRIGTIGTLETSLGLFTVALNDMVRIEADATNPASIAVRAYRNGVLQLSVADTSAGRLTVGIPGIVDRFCSAGIVCRIKNFSCGAL